MSKDQPIFHYKSNLTHQKLTNYKQRAIEHFDYENVDQIESKYQKFSQSFNKLVEDAEQRHRHQLARASSLAAPPKKQVTSQVKFAEIDNTKDNYKSHMHTSKSQKIMKKKKSMSMNIESAERAEPWVKTLMDENFKQMLIKNTTAENPVVSFFGNSLIATVFQSLIIRVIEEKFKIKINLESDIPISVRYQNNLQLHINAQTLFDYCNKSVLKMFDLSTVAIRNIKGAAAKREYIYSTMCKKIDSLLDSFDEKIDTRQNKSDVEEKNKLKYVGKVETQDQFKWLKLKVTHESLRKKLRQTIVEKLNEYENLLLVDETLSLKTELKNQGKVSEAGHLTAQINNVNFTSTKDIFKDMGKYGSHKIKQYLSRLGLADYGHNEETDKGDGLKQTRKIWDDDKEGEFQQQRAAKKYIYSNEVVSSNWNDVGFLPFVQRYILEYKKTMHRDFLIDRYKGGEWLTSEELRFLANTSELLNSCIDKDYMQRAVNSLDPDIIDNMELGLAEQILQNYEEAKLAIKMGRQEFLKVKQEKQQEWLHEEAEKERKQQLQLYNANFYRRYYKMFVNILDKMEREKKFADKLPDNVHGAEFLNYYLLGKTDDKESIQNIIKLTTMNEKEFQHYLLQKSIAKQEKKDLEKQAARFSLLAQPQSYSSDAFVKNVKRRKYHPCSKVFLKNSVLENEASQESKLQISIEAKEKLKFERDKRENIKAKEIQKYEITMKSHHFLRKQSNFNKFYSGGPLLKSSSSQSLLDRFHSTGSSDPSAEEMRSILLIQKQGRAYIQHKQIILQKRQAQIAKDYAYKKIIDQIQMNPTQIKIEKSENFQPNKPNILDIQISTTSQNYWNRGGQQSATNIGGVIAEQRDPTSRSNSIHSKISKGNSFHANQSALPSSTQLLPNQKITPSLKKLASILQSPNHPADPIHFIVDTFKQAEQQQTMQIPPEHLMNLQKMQKTMAQCAQQATQAEEMKKLQKDYQLTTTQVGQKLQNKRVQSSKNPYRQSQSVLLAAYPTTTPLHISTTQENFSKQLFHHSDTTSNDQHPENIDKKNDSPNNKSLLQRKQFNHSSYQQKRTSLLLKIPSFAVNVNKYIDTSNLSQQFALNQRFGSKTTNAEQSNSVSSPRATHSPAHTTAHKDSQFKGDKHYSFSKRTHSMQLGMIGLSSGNFNDRSTVFNTQNTTVMHSNSIQINQSTPVSNFQSCFATPQASVSQFVMPSSSVSSPKNLPRNRILNQSLHKGAQGISFLKNSRSDLDSVSDRDGLADEKSNQIEEDECNEDQQIQLKNQETSVGNNSSNEQQSDEPDPSFFPPNFAKLDPPAVIPKLTIKQNRLIAAAIAVNDKNKFQNLLLSGFIFYEGDVNARDQQGNTPLHAAAKAKNLDVLEWLLHKKANPNLRNNQGSTALHVAFAANSLETIILLISKGGDLNIANKNGETPIGFGSKKILDTLGLSKGISQINPLEVDAQIPNYTRSINNNGFLKKTEEEPEFIGDRAELNHIKLSAIS